MIDRFVYEVLYYCPEFAIFKLGRSEQECAISAPLILRRDGLPHLNKTNQPADPYPFLHTNRKVIEEHINKNTQSVVSFFKYPDGVIPVTEM